MRSTGLCGVLIAALAGCDPATSAGFAVSLGEPALGARAELEVLHVIDSAAGMMRMEPFLPPKNTSAWAACYSHAHESIFVCAKRRGAEMHILVSQPFAKSFSPAADSVFGAMAGSLVLAMGAPAVRRCVWQAGATDALSGCRPGQPPPTSTPADSVKPPNPPAPGPVGTIRPPLS